jgi:hypothetical protein
MEPEDLLKGLRAAAINGITAEHVSLGWKRFFHLVCSPQGGLYIFILVFHHQYSRTRD